MPIYAGWSPPKSANPPKVGSEPPKVGSEFLPTMPYPVAQSYYNMQGQVGAAKANAEGQIGAAKAAAQGQIGAAGAASQGQATAGLGNAYSDAYGAYSTGLGNVATARAADRANFYNANALAEQARQGALGQLGAAGLGAYGSASNAALGAWATNQTAYNKALADMQAANQAAMSGYGASRNAALGQQSTALGSMASSLGNASRVDQGSMSMGSSFGGGGGGGGFNATGYDGEPVASGSYGGMGGGGVLGGMAGSRMSGPGAQFGGVMAGGFGGMNNALSGIMDPGVMNRLDYGAAAGMQQLDNQHYTSRGMPSQMLDQTLGGLTGLSGMNINALQGGMNQYYATANDPRNRARFGDVLQGLGSGFNAATGGINNLSRSVPGVLTPLQQAQESAAAAELNRQNMLNRFTPAATGEPQQAPAPRPTARPAVPSPPPRTRSREADIEAAKLTAQYNSLAQSLGPGNDFSTNAKDLAKRADTQWKLKGLSDRIRALTGLGGA